MAVFLFSMYYLFIMFFALFQSSPGIAIAFLAVILISITVHEFAHAYASYLLGDKTAEMAGRMTLNPLSHIDPVGMLALLILGFGWAKPVPFNPYNLKDPKKDAVYIALAGPFANLILSVAAALVFRGMSAAGLLAIDSLLPTFLLLLVIINLFLLFFNLIPIPPLDGSKLIDALLVKPEHQQLRQAIFVYGPQVLMVLVVVSIFTSYNVFSFVTVPSEIVCTLLMGASCGI